MRAAGALLIALGLAALGSAQPATHVHAASKPLDLPEALSLQAALEIAAKQPTLRQAARWWRRPRAGGDKPDAIPTPPSARPARIPRRRAPRREVGPFIQQRVVTGGKLGLAQDVLEQDRRAAEQGELAQISRVRNGVRSLFYRAGGAAAGGGRASPGRHRRRGGHDQQDLANVGQADRPDVLQADIEAQAAEMALVRAGRASQAWRMLAAAMGRPDLEPRPLQGDLEALPRLDHDAALQRLLADSPEISQAVARTARAEATIQRERAAVVPDIMAKAGFRYNPASAADGRPVGREGLFEIGVDIPIFNRNRGNVSAAKADAERAQAEVERLKLTLQQRLAIAYQDYAASAALAERYRERMLPRARESYELYMSGFRRMAAAYPQVLIAQRNLFQLQEDYVRTLSRAWQSAVSIEGMLLTEALDAPL